MWNPSDAQSYYIIDEILNFSIHKILPLEVCAQFMNLHDRLIYNLGTCDHEITR